MSVVFSGGAASADVGAIEYVRWSFGEAAVSEKRMSGKGPLDTGVARYPGTLRSTGVLGACDGEDLIMTAGQDTALSPSESRLLSTRVVVRFSIDSRTVGPVIFWESDRALRQLLSCCVSFPYMVSITKLQLSAITFHQSVTKDKLTHRQS